MDALCTTINGTVEPKYKYLSKMINNLIHEEDNFVCITSSL